jgi:hypothetical protein
VSPGPRTWRWRTVSDPNRPPGAPRIPHPLADRVGQAVTVLCRGSNGNELMVFPDGHWTIAPWRAALRSKP